MTTQADIVIYTAENCPYCVRATELLDSKKLQYTKISIDKDDKQRQEMMQKSGRRTVPQIFIKGQSIGGYDDLYALVKANKLDELLKS
jgi:glutaredoxin 3